MLTPPWWQVSIIYLGLRSMVYKHEPCNLNWNNLLGQAVCSEDAFEFADMLSPKEAAGTLAKADIENDFIAYELQDCMNNIDSACPSIILTTDIIRPYLLCPPFRC